YLRIATISVAHSVTITEVRQSSRQADRKINVEAKTPTSPSTGPPLPTPSVTDLLDEYGKKVERVQIGMTYEEMIAAAGAPRLMLPLEGIETSLFDKASLKYNYGRKWVYFRGHVVAYIGRENEVNRRLLVLIVGFEIALEVLCRIIRYESRLLRPNT